MYSSCATRTELFYAHPGKKNLEKILHGIASKTGAILIGKNLLPEGSKFFPLRITPVLEAIFFSF